jgi:hypothetical protein
VDILLIHWKIKHSEEEQQEFLKFWTRKLQLKEEARADLVGEFLSKPLTREDVEFPCEVFEESTDYVSYFNVGIWTSASSFKRHVYDLLASEDRDLFPFEVELPKRMVLSPLHWRIGRAGPPDSDNLRLEDG